MSGSELSTWRAKVCAQTPHPYCYNSRLVTLIPRVLKPIMGRLHFTSKVRNVERTACIFSYVKEPAPRDLNLVLSPENVNIY